MPDKLLEGAANRKETGYNTQMWLFIFCAALFSLPAISAKLSPTVLYTASRQGEIEPCGCKVNQIGGLDRMATRIEQVKENHDVLFVDAGNTFFPSPTPSKIRREQDKRKAELIAKSYHLMGLRAFSPGERDFAESEKKLAELVTLSGADLVSANLEFKNIRAKRAIFIDLGSVRVGVTGITQFQGKKPSGIEVSSATESLKRLFEATKTEKVDQWILLAHLEQETEKQVAESFPGVWIISSFSLDFQDKPKRLANSWVFEPGIEGQRLGEVMLDGASHEPQNPKLIELGKELSGAGPVKKAMEKYYLGLKTLPSRRQEKEGQWVANAFQCKSCHEAQFEFWKNTSHSSAVIALYEKGQQDDPSCVGCHSIGYQEKKGFTHFAQSIQSKKNKMGLAEKLLQLTMKEKDRNRQKKTYWKELEEINHKEKITKVFWGVQCEHCHESRLEHVQTGRLTGRGVSLSTCQNCHRPPNAPDFDPKALVKVACPKMKEKDA